MKVTTEVKVEVGEERRLRQRSSKVSYVEQSEVSVPASRRGRDSRGKPTILKFFNRRSKIIFKSESIRKMKPKSKGGSGGGENWANLLFKSKQCLFCGKLSATSRYLEDHYRTHTGEQPFICRKCGKTFTSQGILWAHKKNAHRRPDDQGYACNYCAKIFSTTGSRWVHQKLHEGILKYKCVFCPRKFLTPGHKYDHQKKCGKIKPGGSTKKTSRKGPRSVAYSIRRKKLQEKRKPIKPSTRKKVTVTVWKGTGGQRNGAKCVRRSSRVKIERPPSPDMELATVPKVGRGRPRKSTTASYLESSDFNELEDDMSGKLEAETDSLEAPPPVKLGRGRPRKSTTASYLESSDFSELDDGISSKLEAETDSLEAPPPVKLGRGRPRKSTTGTATTTSTSTPLTSNQAVAKVGTMRRRSSRVREPIPSTPPDSPTPTTAKNIARITTGRRQRNGVTSLMPKSSSLSQSKDSTCNICRKICPNPRALVRHMSRMHHDEEDLKYHCDRDKCDKSYTEHWQLRRHIQMSHTAVPGGHKCSIRKCSGVFANAFLLHAHQRKVHGLNDNVRFRCNHCNKGFDAIMHLIAHKRMCHAKLTSKCFTSKAKFKKEVSEPGSDDVEGYRCPRCVGKFNTKKRLQLHLSVEHGSSRQGKVLSLQQHKARAPKKVSSKFVPRLKAIDFSSIVCIFCGNVFKNKYIFEYHFNKHTKELPYVCSGCSKGFYAPGTLANHQKRCLDDCSDMEVSESEEEEEDDDEEEEEEEEEAMEVEEEDNFDLTHEEAQILEIRLAFMFRLSDKLVKRAWRRRTGFLEGYQSMLRRKCWQSRRLRNRQIFGCPICPEMFSMKTHLNTHIVETHPSEEPGQPRKAFETYECCPLSFVTETELFRHKCENQLKEELEVSEPVYGPLKLTRDDLRLLQHLRIVKEGEVN